MAGSWLAFSGVGNHVLTWMTISSPGWQTIVIMDGNRMRSLTWLAMVAIMVGNQFGLPKGRANVVPAEAIPGLTNWR